MAWSFVGDSNAANSASGTTLSTTATANAAGNHLFVFVVYSATGTTTTTISDTAGNTFTPLTQFQAVSQLLWGQWFYCLNAKGNAANVVTMSLGAARSNRIIRVLEFSSPSAVLDQEVGPVTNTGTSISSGAFSTPRDGIVLVGEINWNSDSSTDFGTNYTALSSLQNYSKQAYRIDSGALTGEVVTFSSTISTNRGLGGASFVTASASGQTVLPGGASVALNGNAPTISQATTIAPGSASVAITGGAPAVSQQAFVVSPGSASIGLVGNAPTVTQGTTAPPPVSDGGGAGNWGEVRRFADLLDKAHKLTRSQKKKRRAELVEEVREVLPPLPEAEKIAPAIAQIVFEQESKARAMYADRPIEAMAPVVVPFDAKAAIAELVARFMADEAMRRQIEAEQAEEDEIDAFLLLGS